MAISGTKKVTLSVPWSNGTNLSKEPHLSRTI